MYTSDVNGLSVMADMAKRFKGAEGRLSPDDSRRLVEIGLELAGIGENNQISDLLELW